MFSIMTDQKVLAYLSGLVQKGIHLDLCAIEAVLARMNSPQNSYPSVLVAGTNGKGSICAMTSSILSAAGYNVGLYTSPHLVDIRERIRYKGRMISREDMVSCIEDVRQCADDSLTYFEFLTACAFQYFRKKKVDIAVLEVGMGGRLDATNVVKSVVSAVSNIAVEHSAYLGSHLSQIAAEKAGVIKEGGICITAATQSSVIMVMEDVCRERRATLYRVGRDIRVKGNDAQSGFSYRGLDRTYLKLFSSLRGRHQVRNAAIALGITEILCRRGWLITEQAIRDGLCSTRWEGRLEVVEENPRVVLDGAHNPAGIAALCSALKEIFFYKKLIVVCGVLEDKNYKRMIRAIAAKADILILTRPVSERAMPPQEMTDIANRYCPHVLIEDRPDEALAMAWSMAAPEDLICVTGSLYLVGRIKELLSPSIKS
ncbi:MAG: Folylpolyglutamate synthase [Syntrophus sp. SKADARSKE-3]|nr:Folylpolyglutamate synthase [Syntrophus sp. SKADARSKE-3]